MILLDTNVISELLRPHPEPQVLTWADEHLAAAGTTTITLAELRYGVLKLPVSGRREQLLEGIRSIEAVLWERTLPFDRSAAQHYAAIRVARERDGSPVASEDLMIAAIARSGRHVVATRNVRHFEGYGMRLVDPWR